MIDILFPHEEKARKEFMKEYKKIQEKYGLPEIEEVEETLHLNFPTLRKTANIKIEEALLFMLRTAYDQLTALLSQLLFPRDPVRAIESPFKSEEEKRRAHRVFIELLLKYWKITKALREGSNEEKINLFKEEVKEFKEYDDYIGNLIGKTIKKLEEELEKIKRSEGKLYFR